MHNKYPVNVTYHCSYEPSIILRSLQLYWMVQIKHLFIDETVEAIERLSSEQAGIQNLPGLFRGHHSHQYTVSPHAKSQQS